MKTQPLEKNVHILIKQFPALLHDLIEMAREGLLIWNMTGNQISYVSEYLHVFFQANSAATTTKKYFILDSKGFFTQLSSDSLSVVRENELLSELILKIQEGDTEHHFPFNIRFYQNEEKESYAVLFLGKKLESTSLKKVPTDIYQSLFNSSNELIGITNFQGRFEEVNHKWAETSGYSLDELKGKYILRFVHPDDLQETFNAFKKLYRGYTDNILFKSRMCKKNGDIIWIEWNAVTKQDEKRIYTIAREITNQIKSQSFKEQASKILIQLSAESALKNISYDDFMHKLLYDSNQLLKTSSISIWDYDATIDVIRCKYHHTLTNTRNHDLKGIELAQSELPQYFNSLKEGKALNADDVYQDERVHELRNDYFTKFNIKSMLDAQINGDNGLIGVICAEQYDNKRKWRDEEIDYLYSLTEIISKAVINRNLKSSKAKLEDVNLQLNLALKAANLGLWELNADGVYSANAQIKNIFEIPSSTDISDASFMASYVVPEDLQIIQKLFSKTSPNQVISNYRYRIITPSGKLKYLLGFAHCLYKNFNEFDKWIGVAIDITELTESQQLLSENEEKLRATINTIDDLIFVLDKDGIFKEYYVPKFSPRGLHKRPEEVINKHYSEVVEPILQKKLDHLYHYFQSNRDTQSFDYSLSNSTGIQFWFSANASARINEKNELNGITIVSRDVSVRKGFEIALKEEKERVEYILRGTNVGTWQWEVPTGKTIFNERWAEMLGYTIEELAPVSIKTWEVLAHPDDLKEASFLLKKHFNKELDYYHVEMRMKHKNGHWVWIQDRGKVSSWDDEGNPVMMHGTHLDISDRKYVELAMNKLVNSFSSLKGVELFNDICRYTAESLGFEYAFVGQYQQFDQSIQMQNFYDKGQFREPEFYHIKDTPTEKLLLEGKALIIPEDLVRLFPNDAKLKELNIQSYAGVPLFDSSANIIGVFILLSETKSNYTEITESIISVFRSRIANELERLKGEKQLELLLDTTKRQNSRLRSFSFITSHNIRSSVSNILGLTEVILEDPSDSDMMIPMLNQAAKNLDLSIKNANELLQVEEKVNIDKLKDCNLHDSIERVVYSLKELIDTKEAELEIKIEEGYLIRANEAYLESIFYNLISNALKYGVNEHAKQIIVSAHHSTQGNIIQVQDFGEGIWEQANLKKIFELGTRLHHSKDGQGFGLFMTKQQVEVMGGRIDVASEKNKGVLFTVTLP